MEIKNINIRKVKAEGNLKAVASVNFDDLFVVHGLRLVQGKDGLFLSFPAVIKKDGKYLDIAHPIDSGFRDTLTSEIIKAYENIQDEVENDKVESTEAE